MRICIYCEKKDREVIFGGREHVVPRLMGVFKNNPTLVGWVCNNCNSTIFSPLEARFKEDTEEGIFYQMFNLEKSSQIRIRGKNIKSSFSSGLGDKFFDQMFPFFQVIEGKTRIALLPQIKIRRYGDNGYLILLVEELKKIKGTKRFLKIKDLLKGVTSKDISIFTVANSIEDNLLHEAVGILSDLGINYKEEKRKFAAVKPKDRPIFEISMDCTVGQDSARIIAKIAFNYFSYCALQGNYEKVLFHSNFAQIKSYILGLNNIPIREVISDIKNESIITEKINGKMKPVNFLAHMITFRQEGEKIVAYVSFLGRRIYTVILGNIPDELKLQQFGSGHVFDPVSGKIVGLTQNPLKMGTYQEIGFGLFNRI